MAKVSDLGSNPDEIDRSQLTVDERIKYGAAFRWGYDYKTDVSTMPQLQDKFLTEYCLVPKSERPTLDNWSREHGVDVRTLYRWKKDERFIKEWNKRWHRDIAHPDTVVPIIENLMDIAQSKNSPQAVQAAKLYLELTRQLAPPEVKVTVTPDQTLAAMSDQEIYDRLHKIIEDRTPQPVEIERGDGVLPDPPSAEYPLHEGASGVGDGFGGGTFDASPGDDTSGSW